MLRLFVLLVLLLPLVAMGEEERAIPLGIVPEPAEPGIQVTLSLERDVYAPGEYLRLHFTLSQEAYVYLYDIRPDGVVELLVPNRFLQEPRFPAGEHVLPTEGWRLRVTEPEGREYLELIATDRPLPFYEAKAFEAQPFLRFTDPAAFARRLQELLVGAWGAAWTSFTVHRPRATLRIDTDPPGALAWADGTSLGTTPLVAEVAPGEVELRLEKPGYRARVLSLTLADGDELALMVALEEAPPTAVEPVALEELGFGISLGLNSVGAELWGDGLGLGLAVRTTGETPPEGPGPGGWFPLGPELEFYGIGWLALRARGWGLLGLVGIGVQEWAWYPPWYPQGVQPAVEVEPETVLKAWPTLGLGLGMRHHVLSVYLLWHTRRGLLLGFGLRL